MTKEKRLVSSTLRRGGVGSRAGGAVMVRFTALGLNALVGILLARALPVDERGLYALAVTIASVSALLMTLGLDTATLRASGGLGYLSAVHAAYRRAGVAVLAVSGFAAAVLAMPSTSFLGLSQAEMLLAMAASPVIVLHQLLGNCMLGAQRMRIWATGVAGNVVVYGVVCLGVVVVGKVSIAAFTIALGAGFLAGLIPFLRVTMPLLRRRSTVVERRELRVVSRATWVPTLAQLILLRAQIPVLLVLAGSTAVGYLSIAIPIAEVLLVVPIAISSVVLPLYHAAPRTEHEIRRHAAVSFATTGVGALVIVVLAPILVPWLYGSSYAPAIVLIQILAPSVPVFAYARVLQSSMYADGRFAAVARASVAALIVTVSVQLLASREWAATGAAVAIATGYVTFALILSLERRRKVAT